MSDLELNRENRVFFFKRRFTQNGFSVQCQLEKDDQLLKVHLSRSIRTCITDEEIQEIQEYNAGSVNTFYLVYNEKKNALLIDFN